jgi:hypothetical protein
MLNILIWNSLRSNLVGDEWNSRDPDDVWRRVALLRLDGQSNQETCPTKTNSQPVIPPNSSFLIDYLHEMRDFGLIPVNPFQNSGVIGSPCSGSSWIHS